MSFRVPNMTERFFHGVCGLIFLLSLGAFIHGDRRERLTDNPREDLLSFLQRQGGIIGEPRGLPNGEQIIPLSFAVCEEWGFLVYLPVIHRISDAAKKSWSGEQGVTFVHDRRAVSSLGPLVVIPRWLVRRLAVNFQLMQEDPWISIAFALVPPQGCRWPSLDWAALSESS